MEVLRHDCRKPRFMDAYRNILLIKRALLNPARHRSFLHRYRPDWRGYISCAPVTALSFFFLPSRRPAPLEARLPAPVPTSPASGRRQKRGHNTTPKRLNFHDSFQLNQRQHQRLKMQNFAARTMKLKYLYIKNIPLGIKERNDPKIVPIRQRGLSQNRSLTILHRSEVKWPTPPL